MDSKKKSSDNVDISVSLVYLIIYNTAQALGWTLLTVRMLTHYLDNGLPGLYSDGAVLLNVFQTLAVMEIIHPMIGIVKTNVVLTAFQIFSRLFLTWGIAYSVKEVQNTKWVAMFMIAWSITEIIRYSYYTCAQVKNIPYFLQWCRYTFFIVLYPVGVTGELMSVYVALPYLKSTGIFSVPMPNRANMSFDYYSMCIFAMFMYIPVFPQLYLHMFAQRRKIIGQKSKAE